MSNGSGKWGYLYNAEGERVVKGAISSLACPDSAASFTSVTAEYLLNQSGEQATELTGAGAWVHTNIWAGGSLDATYDASGLHFHLKDPLGTRRVQLSAAAGCVEDSFQSLPWGNDLTPTPGCGGVADSTEHHFTSKVRDTESGNDYFGARYYGSSMGRFLSPDQGPWKLDDPQYFDMYEYALNNPLHYGDEEGDTPQDRVNKANALAAENIPYVSGGGHPGNKMEACGLDCSGLVRAVFKADPDNTLNINGTAATEATQFQSGGQYSTDINDAQVGDAIFFSNSSGAIVHTGIVVDIRDGKIYFVHAPRPGKKVDRFYIKINDPQLGSEAFAGVGRSNEAGGHAPAQNVPTMWQRMVAWFFSFFPNSGGNTNPNPEGHPKRHTTVPCLKHRDGSCAN